MNQSNSKILVHFTGIDHKRGIRKPQDVSFEIILNILPERSFRVSLSERELHIPRKIFNLKIPMTCFSETPVHFLRQHMNIFGDFGIGMNFDWGIESGFLNVIYSDNLKPNFYSMMLSELWEYLYSLGGISNPNISCNWLYSLVGSTENIRYRDEREWRYISKYTDLSENYNPLSICFLKKDVNSIFVPREYVNRLNEFLDKDQFLKDSKIQVIPSEEII